MPNLFTKVNARATPSSVADELHTIGEDEADVVFLNEIADNGTLTVTGSGGTPTFTDAGAPGPAAGQYYHVPGTSKLEFNSADNGTAVEVDYDRKGTEATARDWNRVHDKIQGVKTIADGVTVTLDFTDEWANTVELAGNRDIVVSEFPPAGAFVVLEIHQDVTGTRVPTWDSAGGGADFDFGTDGAPTLTTTADKMDLLTFYSDGAKLLFVGIKKGFAS